MTSTPQTTNPESTDAPARSVLRALRDVLTHQRALVSALCAVIAFGWMIAAAFDFRVENQQRLVDDGFAKTLAGAAFLLFALYAAPSLPALVRITDAPLSAARRRGWLFAGGALVLSLLLSEINGTFTELPVFQETVTQHVQFVMLLGVCGGLIYGLGGAPRIVWGALRRIDWRQWAREWLPVIAIVVFALIIRAWDVGDYMRYLIDELHWTDGVQHLEGSAFRQLMVPMSGQSPYTWVYSYWQAGAAQVFDHNLFALRFPSAVVGALNVLAVYGLARAIGDRRFALLAMIVVAVLPSHVQFSRIALNQIADALFGTMALMFVARGMRNNHRADWAAAGVSVGMTQYFYEGGRLLFPPLVALWIVVMIVITRGHLRRQWGGIVIAVVAALVIAIPVYAGIVGNDKPLFGRFSEMSDSNGIRGMLADGLQTEDVTRYVDHALTTVWAYIAHRDLAVYYGGEQPLVVAWLVPLFLVGVFYALWRIPAMLIVVPLWIAATSGGVSLMRDTLYSARYAVVLPALGMAVAAGLRYWLPLIVPDAPKTLRSARWVRRVTYITAALIAVSCVVYYFAVHIPILNVQTRDQKGYHDGLDAVHRIVTLPGNTQPYLIGMPEHDQNVPRNFLGYLSLQDGGNPGRYYPILSVTTDTVTPRFLDELPRDVNYAFFVEASASETIRLIYAAFPNAHPPEYTPFEGVPVTKAYVQIFAPTDAQITGTS